MKNTGLLNCFFIGIVILGIVSGKPDRPRHFYANVPKRFERHVIGGGMNTDLDLSDDPIINNEEANFLKRIERHVIHVIGGGMNTDLGKDDDPIINNGEGKGVDFEERA